MNDLTMDIRAVDDDARTITGIVAPYDEVSYLTPDPAGERIIRGAFQRSIDHVGTKVRLFVGHDNKRAAVGVASSWHDDAAGLTATFRLANTPAADAALHEAREDLYGGLSVGFRPIKLTRGADGVREVREAALHEVSLVGIPSYAGARVTAVRAATVEELLAPFGNRPAVDLSPIPATWLYDSGR